MLELSLPLDRSAGIPLADQLADHVRTIAARGGVRVGEKLPSTRELAATLRVSRTVTAAAYDQLHAEGWITGRHGSGTYVVAVPFGQAPGQAMSESPSPEMPPDATDLRPGSPWAGGVHSDMWRRAWRAASDEPPSLRPERPGLESFRAVVVDRLLRHRGLTPAPSTVLATNGTSAALLEFALAVLAPGDAVAVEEPGYPRALGAIRAAGLEPRPVPVDDEGMIIDRIPQDVRAVYCTPAHQFPLGARMTATRRLALVNWARVHGAWVIEDDYDGELRYDVAPLPLLATLGEDVVVHLGTASKIVSPTLGVGWMVAPPSVVNSIIQHRERAASSPNPAGQRVFAAMARSGDLSRHLRRLRRELSVRRDNVVTALTSIGLKVEGDNAGAHVFVPLSDAEREEEFINATADKGVLIDGLARHFAGRRSRAGIVVGYAAPADRGELADALTRLTMSLG